MAPNVPNTGSEETDNACIESTTQHELSLPPCSSSSSNCRSKTTNILEERDDYLLQLTPGNIVMYGTIVIILGTYAVLFSVSNLSDLPFLTKAFIFCLTELSLVVFMINLGLLAFVIFNVNKRRLMKFICVANRNPTDLSKIETVLAFTITVVALPLWLLIRHYSLRCLLGMACVPPFVVFQLLNDLMKKTCGPSDPTSPESISICHAFVTCLPTTILTFAPLVIGAVFCRFCLNHPTSYECFPRVVAPPPALFDVSPKSRKVTCR